MNTTAGDIRFRSPRAADGRRIWELVHTGGAVEENSAYCYVLLCTHFARHGLIAERAGELAGFITAYRPPGDPETVFVWQVCVAPAGRGQGLGAEMLNRLIERPDNRDARYLGATVAPGNQASNRLFAAFARTQNAPLAKSAGFAPQLFPAAHAAEPLLRIGPLAARDETLADIDEIVNELALTRRNLA